MQLPPGDRPSGLDRFLGELGITACDDEADGAHVRVMGVHEAREGHLVTVRSEAHQPAEVSVALPVMVTIAR